MPLADTFGAFARAQAEGSVGAYGVSNFDAAQLAAAVAAGAPRAIQNSYSLLERGDEREVLPLCARQEVAYLAFGFTLYLCLQGVAICVTTVLQEEVDDAYRGRMFAFYDVMFNVSLAAGALLSTPFMPVNGKSAAIVAVVAAGYAVAAAGYWLLSRQSSADPPDTSTPSASAQSSSS